MITFNDVSKQYEVNKVKVHALNNISLKIRKSEILGVYGPSGSGKSTILKLINKLVSPDSGDIKFEGQSIVQIDKNQTKEYVRKTALIFQNFNLVSNIKVIDNVSLPLRLQGVSKVLAEKAALEKLKLVNLEDHATKYPNQLSGGQQQRVAIARALVTNPEILLCDEITSSLDYTSKLEILTLLKEINLKYKITIILVSHEHEVIKYLADRVLILEDGVIKNAFEIKNENLIKDLINYKAVFNYDK